MASPATWDHGEVIARAAIKGHESIAIHHQRSVLMSMAHIITREHRIVPESSPCISPRQHSKTSPGVVGVWVCHS